VPADCIDEWVRLANNLPNLQLLEGQINVEKQNTLPLDWVEKKFKDPMIRDHYLAEQELTGLPTSLVDFPAFYNLRKQRLADRLKAVLGVAAPYEATIA
jgi:hypothetical protein